eukprot:767580-Hanusia_phi.AAC.5
MALYGAVAPTSYVNRNSAKSAPKSNWNAGTVFLGIIAGALVISFLAGDETFKAERKAPHYQDLSGMPPVVPRAAAGQMKSQASQMQNSFTPAMSKQRAVQSQVASMPVQAPVSGSSKQSLQAASRSACPTPAQAPPAPAQAPSSSTSAQGGEVTKRFPSGSSITNEIIPQNIKGGKGKEIQKSVEEAIQEKPNSSNSHYIAGHTDK